MGVSNSFSYLLAVGGKSNSLGRAGEVIDAVLQDKSRLAELYNCLFVDNAWARMRAADALEKICRVHPEWMQPFIDTFQKDLATSTQPSIQWHLAQIYRQVDLTLEQKDTAIGWLRGLLSTKDIDWIVAANAMSTLFKFVQDGSFSSADMVNLLKIQQQHKSTAVVRRATKLLDQLSA